MMDGLARAMKAANLAAGSVPSVARAAVRWLPAGKHAAVCFSVDDVHPGTSEDAYEGGGDLAAGGLGRLQYLLQRHADLTATLCVTPDWRLKSLVPDTGLLRHIPWMRRHAHWTRLHPPGRFRLDRHPSFVAFLNGLERCQVVPHGLSHAHTGPRIAAEFQDQSEEQCEAAVQQALEIFRLAGLRFVRGFTPPAWLAPPALIRALERLDFQFLCSARDLRTPVSPQAVTSMSGLAGVSLIYPQLLSARGLVHVSCNFQASSPVERAIQILELGGVLHVKAHIFKSGGGHVMTDGLDAAYCNYLDLLFSHLAARFGRALWWAHISDIAQRVRHAHDHANQS
jgi:Uncharacterized protein conserved in bacteria (DUF2334)